MKNQILSVVHDHLVDQSIGRLIAWPRLALSYAHVCLVYVPLT